MSFEDVKPVQHVKTMWELSHGAGVAVFNSLVEILKLDPEIHASRAIDSNWDRLALIEFSDHAVDFSYDRHPGIMKDGLTLGHSTMPLKNNTEVNTKVRQKLIELLADGGLDRYLHNTIVGAEKIMVERYNALTDNAVVYFDNSK